MFRNRQSSQKPPDELFEQFRQSFPDVRAATSAPSERNETVLASSIQDPTLNQPRFLQDDMDPTPRALVEPFRFTPSVTPSAFMDPTSSAFAAFANQPAGLFTPTPGTSSILNGTMTALSHNMSTGQDLQTQNIGISMGAPLSMPGNVTMAPPTDIGTYANPQTIQPHQFQNYNFNQPMNSQYLDPTQYETGPPSGPGSPMDCSGGELQDPLAALGAMTDFKSMPLSEKKYDEMSQMLPNAGRFRFHVVLNAPTAMIKHPEEIPVTYLNKGQAYAVSIVDTNPPMSNGTPVRYRTFIRISFHDETQRKRPAGCWQLWKEGRGTSESHHRGGKLQAVEYVENPSNGDEDTKRRVRVDLDSSSFDGFSVIWSPTDGGPAETSVSVRFNFLSTDFSHSKGVKGIPVRLCAKTEILSTGSSQSSSEESPEVAYCKVKLFRDHGAERKLANDILHVKKTIEKLKQQATQVEGTGMKIFGKKPKKEEIEMPKPGKAPKHKRTWSMSSASSVGGPRTQEEDTNAKLQSMQDMFTSTRLASVLYLKGDENDDPDLHPVSLPGENGHDWDRRNSVATSRSNASSSFVSPTPSSASLSSRRGGSFSPDKSWQQGSQADVPVKVRKRGSADGVLSGWIEAIGIDSNYQPPASPPPKAVMCIYILPVFPDQKEAGAYHRACYLPNRSASCLMSSIAVKCGIDPSTVFRTIHINQKGLTVFVDDDFVQQMNEGQDMKIQVQEIQEDPSFSSPQEWANSNTQQQPEGSAAKKFEIRLVY